MERTLMQPLIAVLISSLIAIRAYRRKSLDLSGAISGFIVMSIHIAVGYRYGALILVFFFTSSKLTKVGEEKKRRVDADFKEGGQRNWVQVLSNSGIATIFVLIIWRLTEWEEKCLDSKNSVLITALIGGVIGHYACCNGDTWSSELGVLSDAQPRLITTFKWIEFLVEELNRSRSIFGRTWPVRKGTNGGVTKTGLLAAAAAGSVIGLTFVVLGFLTAKCTYDAALKQLLVVPLSTIAGLLGSMIDSLLGATLQFSGFCTVRNKTVNYPQFFSGTGVLIANPSECYKLLDKKALPLCAIRDYKRLNKRVEL
ncbi:Transmembrane protein 19 [Morus notabilis]|uniref:Transmembrane protein 19 n=1 Tax=Morus notabilis TaxID=981085 RepID=W9R8Q1_9ROSA|nr:Transmembrane protein 19 [Morus notabilis]